MLGKVCTSNTNATSQTKLSDCIHSSDPEYPAGTGGSSDGLNIRISGFIISEIVDAAYNGAGYLYNNETKYTILRHKGAPPLYGHTIAALPKHFKYHPDLADASSFPFVELGTPNNVGAYTSIRASNAASVNKINHTQSPNWTSTYSPQVGCKIRYHGDDFNHNAAGTGWSSSDYKEAYWYLKKGNRGGTGGPGT